MVHGNYYSTLYAVITRLHREEMEQGEFTAGITRTHRLYPSHQPIKSEAKKCEDKVTVHMVSPAQATVEQARSEARQLKEQERSHPSAKKRRSIQTRAKPRKKSKYSGTLFEDGS